MKSLSATMFLLALVFAEVLAPTAAFGQSRFLYPRVKKVQEAGGALYLESLTVFGPKRYTGETMLSVVWGNVDPKKRTIKKVVFTLQAYNAAGEPVKDARYGYTDYVIEIEERIPPYEVRYAHGSTGYEGIAWVNQDLTCVRIVKASVMYTDGSSYIYEKELPKNYGKGFDNMCPGVD